MVCGVWVNYGLWVKCGVCLCVCVRECMRTCVHTALGGVVVSSTVRLHGYHDYIMKLPWQLEPYTAKKGVWKIIPMKIEGVTHSLTGKQYFLKYYDHLGTFSLKILYSRCIFVKQSRVIFSYTRFEEQWLNATILREPGNWLYRGVWFSWHCGGLCGHIRKKKNPSLELPGWTGEDRLRSTKILIVPL